MHGHAHRVLVIFTDIDNGQFPDRGQVERLVEGPFVDSSITEIASDDAVQALVLHGEGDARGNRQLRADDGIATVNTEFIAPHVHGAAFSFAAAGGLAESSAITSRGSMPLAMA